MKRLIPLVVLVAVALMLFPVQAQDSQTIEYGETVTFELSGRDDEIDLQFTGKANEVIVAFMQSAGFPTNIVIPELQLESSEGELLVDTTFANSVYGATLAFELPSDNTYTLIATIDDATSGDAVGEYMLYLSRVAELLPDQPLSDTATTGTHSNYYLVRQTGQPMRLTYHKLEGNVSLEITVNELHGGGLAGVITLYGERLTDAEVALPTNIDPLIISAGGFNFTSLRMDHGKISYELTVS